MIGLVWAQSANGVIGRDGALPWHLPEDLAHFRTLTAGATVIMGRRTWDSLPPRFRPLPGRHNRVLTRDRSWRAEGAHVVHYVADALTTADDVWVIGGAEVYQATLLFADVAMITELREEFEGDTAAPMLVGRWGEAGIDPEAGWHESSTGLHYRFRTLRYQD